MRILIIAILISVSFSNFAQKHIDFIKVGDFVPKEIRLGGFKEVETEVPNCRVFSIKYENDMTDTWTRQSIQSQKDAQLSTVIGIHFNSENIVVGIIKTELWVNEEERLEGYKKRLEYDLQLIENYNDIDLITIEKSYNGDISTKYHSYSMLNNGENKVKVIRTKGVVKNVVIEETYIPNSTYKPRFELKNEDELDDGYNGTLTGDDLYNICANSVKNHSGFNTEKVCNCFLEKVVANFSDKGITNTQNDLSPLIEQCLSENLPSKIKLSYYETPVGWRWVYGSDIVGEWKENEKTIPHPFQCMGDYNMDNLSDTTWILLKNDNSGWGIFVFLSENDSISYAHKVIEYDMTIKPQFINISTQKPGIYKTACGKGYWDCGENEPEVLNLKMPSIYVTPYESGGASTIYWNDTEQKFKKVIMND
jgi:hypothetical protein